MRVPLRVFVLEDKVAVYSTVDWIPSGVDFATGSSSVTEHVLESGWTVEVEWRDDDLAWCASRNGLYVFYAKRFVRASIEGWTLFTDDHTPVTIERSSTFGNCTVMKGDGLYISDAGDIGSPQRVDGWSFSPRNCGWVARKRGWNVERIDQGYIASSSSAWCDFCNCVKRSKQETVIVFDDLD